MYFWPQKCQTNQKYIVIQQISHLVCYRGVNVQVLASVYKALDKWTFYSVTFLNTVASHSFPNKKKSHADVERRKLGLQATWKEVEGCRKRIKLIHVETWTWLLLRVQTMTRHLDHRCGWSMRRSRHWLAKLAESHCICAQYHFCACKIFFSVLQHPTQCRILSTKDGASVPLSAASRIKEGI